MKLTHQEILKLSVSTMHIGLMVDIGGAAILYVIGQLLRSENVVPTSASASLEMLGYGLIAVSVAELFTVIVLRKKWIRAGSLYLRAFRSRLLFYRQIKLLFAVLFLVALTPAIYGFLFYLLGGTETIFVLLIVATMIGYMLIRIKPDELEKSIGSIELDDPD